MAGTDVGSKMRQGGRGGDQAAFADSRLSISIVTAPRWLGGELSLRHDTAMVKGALLYADSVKLYSYGATVLANVTAAAGASEDRLAEFIGTVPVEHWPGIGVDLDAVLHLSAADRHRLRQRGRRIWSRNYSDDLERLLASLEQSKFQGRSFGDVVAPDLERLADMGLLLHQADGFSLDPDNDEASYSATLDAIISDPRSRPLFDEKMSRRLRKLMASQNLSQVTKQAASHAREVALATRLIGELQTFPYADLDDILAAREHLAEPLLRYRTTLIEASKTMTALPWSKREFEAEFTDYTQKVHQDIAFVRKALKGTRLWRRASSSARQEGATAGAAILTAALTYQYNDLTHVANKTTLAAAAGGALVGATAAVAKEVLRPGQDVSAAMNVAQRSDFYYLYELEVQFPARKQGRRRPKP